MAFTIIGPELGPRSLGPQAATFGPLFQLTRKTNASKGRVYLKILSTRLILVIEECVKF